MIGTSVVSGELTDLLLLLLHCQLAIRKLYPSSPTSTPVGGSPSVPPSSNTLVLPFPIGNGNGGMPNVWSDEHISYYIDMFYRLMDSSRLLALVNRFGMAMTSQLLRVHESVMTTNELSTAMDKLLVGGVSMNGSNMTTSSIGVVSTAATVADPGAAEALNIIKRLNDPVLTARYISPLLSRLPHVTQCTCSANLCFII
jgi:hypothetical protein